MKKCISIMLALVMVVGMCVSFSACSDEKDAYVGIWQLEEAKNYYIYIYEDGTGDYYSTSYGHSGHHDYFDWKIKDGYLVIEEPDGMFGSFITTLKLSGKQLFDKQGDLYASKYSSSTSKDVR
ncbi:MAG: hypothetical protein E7437_03780 [Ruminococcaceae bacterium]|nr:hypothetical protein [Oscillospiraceae bacterium]